MGSYTRGLELAELIQSAGISSGCDPRSATPPCVLVAPPALAFDTGCGATATWELYALVPGPANADSWLALDDMAAMVAEILPVERLDFVAYSLSVDSPPLPAYRIQFTQGVDV